MFCNHCGTQVPDGTAFCPKCGATLPVSNQPFNPIPPVPPIPQQPYIPQPFVPQQVVEPAKGMAITSFIMGLTSLFMLPIITGLLGILFGAIAKGKGNRSGFSTAGLVCSIIGLIFGILIKMFFGDIISQLLS